MSLRTTERGLIAMAYPQQPYHLMQYGAVEYGSPATLVAMVGSTVAAVVTGRKQAEVAEDAARQQSMIMERTAASDALLAQHSLASNLQLAKFIIPLFLIGGLAAIVIVRDKKR